MMFRLLTVMFLAALMSAPPPSFAEKRLQQPDVVTVIGKISKSNRGAFDPFLDSLFKFHEKEFKTAFGFSFEALASLPQVTVTAEAQGWPTKVMASGPRLRDVLKAAGVSEGSGVAFLSLDGYALEFEAEKLKSKDWILAIRANGRPLGIGGRGPAWLLYDTGGKAVDTDATGQWVYQLFLIEVQ